VPTLRTARLLLRSWRDSDGAPLAAICADPKVAEFLPAPLTPAICEAMRQRFLAHWARHGFGPWAVEHALDGRLLGFAGLQWTAFEAPFAPAVEALWQFASEAWGHGYASEAAQAALDDARDRLGISGVHAFTVPANRRSQRVMKRLGFVRDPAADFDHPRLPAGHPLARHWLYRLPASGSGPC